jgi:hypothetical protein
MLGFWTGNEHGRRNDEVHSPEFLMSGDVLRGYTAFALGQGPVIAVLVVRGKFAFGMGMKISAVALQGEHEKEFSIHPRRRDIGSGEARDGGG